MAACFGLIQFKYIFRQGSRINWKLFYTGTRIEGRIKAVSINVCFAHAGEASIVFYPRHARVSRVSKPAPPARAKRLQWKPAFKLNLFRARTYQKLEPFNS
jgi:hypothetical protein